MNPNLFVKPKADRRSHFDCLVSSTYSFIKLQKPSCCRYCKGNEHNYSENKQGQAVFFTDTWIPCSKCSLDFYPAKVFEKLKMG